MKKLYFVTFLAFFASSIGASSADDFYNAIYEQDITVLEQLLLDPNVRNLVNVPDSLGHLPLGIAAGDIYKEERDDGSISYGCRRNEYLDDPAQFDSTQSATKALRMVRILLVAGAAPCMKDNMSVGTALHYAAKCASAETVRVLLNAGAELGARDNGGCTALHDATAETAPVLLDAGADPRVKDNYGYTPLHGADTQKTRILLDASADPGMKNDFNRTALHGAVDHARHEVARMLLEAGADIDAQDNDGATPLVVVLRQLRLADGGCEGYVYPSRSAYEETIDLLLDRGANVNLPDKDGMTPLHVAAQHCHPDLVEKLLARGADEHAQTVVGKTAFALVLDGLTAKWMSLGASRAGYIRILEILAQ